MDIALIWDSHKDLDLRVTPPSGRTLKPNDRAHSGGKLDLDMNCGEPTSSDPIEHAAFGSPSNGKYEVATAMPKDDHWHCVVRIRGQRTRMFKGYGNATICAFHFQDGDAVFLPSGYAVGEQSY